MVDRRTSFTLAAAAIAALVACIADLPPDGTPPPPLGCGDGTIDLTIGEECDPGLGALDAAAGGCSPSCKVLCPGLKWTHNDHCYQFASTPAESFTDARDRCNAISNIDHVVTFASEDEYDKIAAYASGDDAGSFWVGIWQDTERFDSVVSDEPGWSPACPGCYANTVDPTVPLPSRVVTPDAAAPMCVEAFSDSRASWEELPCTGSHEIHVPCEREPVGVHWTTCDAGICIALVATQKTKRYAYQAGSLAPAEAEARCQALGGSLVVLQSRDEREQLWVELTRLGAAPSRVWIGLSAADAGADADAGAATWLWDDGTAATGGAYPSAWGIRQPESTGRAFLEHSALHPIDDTLARTDPTVAVLPYVCQLPFGDAGP